LSDRIRTLIDESPLTGVQITVVAVCFFLNMLDGMDVLAISFAAPAIAEEWAITRQSLGVVFSAALIGMTAGALFLSPYTDVIGRRRMILISLVLISVGMLATSLANSIATLIVLRFFAGLGIGSMLASMTSMVSEYSPDRWRNVFIREIPSAEANKTSSTIGVIPVDSIFSPVRRVTFDVEHTRVDQSNDYDRVVLEIETDGSISPRDALASAGGTLRALVQLVEEMSEEPQGLELTDVATGTAGSPDLELPIEDLDLSERPRNCLKRAQVNTIGELLTKNADDLLAITNFGQKSLDEVIAKLDERGLSLRGAR